MGLLKNNRKENQIKTIVTCMLAVIILSLMTPVTANAADNIVNIDDPGCSGKLTDLYWTFDPDPDIGIDFSGKKVLGVPIPSLKLGVEFTVGVKGKFDLDLKQGNLPANTTIDTKIDENTQGIYKKKISSNLLDRIPDAVSSGLDVTCNFIAGCTKPVAVKGDFSNSFKLKISLDGVSLTTNPKTEFTSVKPKTPNQETVFFAGSNLGGKLELGEFNLGIVGKVGPILTGTVGSLEGGMGKATLKKDERNFPMHMPADVDVIHSCTENGREGCVSGSVKEVKDKFTDVSVDFTFRIQVPFFDDPEIEVYKKRWPVDHNYTSYNQSNFVQSLTWKENLKKQRECSHMYYKVPVAVWADQEKTVGIKGAHIHVKGGVGVDNNVAMYSMDTTGDAEDLPSNRANLYLPYKDGKYTIVAEKDNVEGEGEQPANMVKGANDQVDIIPIGGEYVTYTAKKKWDTDFEEKDKPKKIEVLLQSLHYNQGYWQWQGVEKAELSADNGWTTEFQEVPKYELDRNGKKQEIKYRIRELRPENLSYDAYDMGGDVGFLDQIDGLMRPAANGNDPLSKACGRVVLSRWDFDNIHVWKQLKNRVQNWDQLWQLSPSLTYLKTFGKDAFFPEPTVVYDVDEYTTAVGERVSAHKTKYQVSYKTEGNTTTITNLAVLNTTMYKRWLMLGDAKTPDSVFLVLCYRPQEKYREYFGGKVAERYAGLWLPLINPLSGNKVNLLSLIGADTLAKFDIFNFISIPVAVGEAKAPGEYENPLVAWRVKFTIKKYGWLPLKVIPPGIPVELQGAELSSVILTDIVKYLTGFDIPISFSFNPFSGDKYITVPGKAYQIPIIDRDWERTSNIINT
ncbi:MAG: Cna B-type domain-containing protein, partial [Oscillospiraceae bacterium]|nr:Cna B-type domain-containing protein [Oscillospiraceae bacterium]